jgi:hypothetical protein
VIDVRMAEHDGIDRFGRYRKLLSIEFLVGATALNLPALEQELAPVYA